MVEVIEEEQDPEEYIRFDVSGHKFLTWCLPQYNRFIGTSSPAVPSYTDTSDDRLTYAPKKGLFNLNVVLAGQL